MKVKQAENVCEHGDHPAPAGKRFCSPECAKCEHADFDDESGEQECAGICLAHTQKGP